MQASVQRSYTLLARAVTLLGPPRAGMTVLSGLVLLPPLSKAKFAATSSNGAHFHAGAGR